MREDQFVGLAVGSLKNQKTNISGVIFHPYGSATFKPKIVGGRSPNESKNSFHKICKIKCMREII